MFGIGKPKFAVGDQVQFDYGKTQGVPIDFDELRDGPFSGPAGTVLEVLPKVGGEHLYRVDFGDTPRHWIASGVQACAEGVLRRYGDTRVR